MIRSRIGEAGIGRCRRLSSIVADTHRLLLLAAGVLACVALAHFALDVDVSMRKPNQRSISLSVYDALAVMLLRFAECGRAPPLETLE